MFEKLFNESGRIIVPTMKEQVKDMSQEVSRERERISKKITTLRAQLNEKTPIDVRAYIRYLTRKRN